METAREALLAEQARARERVAVVAVNVDPLSSGAGFCLCMAPGTAGHWYVPPMWLANLPASPNAPGVPLNYLLVATLPAEVPPRFAARGVAGGALVFSTVRIRTVRYK